MSYRRLQLTRELLLTSLVAVTMALVFLHTSSLRFNFDPLGSAYEWTQVETAKSDVARASARLDIAETRFADFKTIRQTNPSDSRLQKLSQQMVEHDRAAMTYMDKAKKAGVNIRALVKRLCDGLEEQYAVLQAAKQDNAVRPVAILHTEIEEVEAGLDSSGKFSPAIREVKKSLDDAMMW